MNKFTKLAVTLALPLSGAVFASVAVAATAVTVIPVTATVIDSCAVDASALTFGDYNGISGGTLDAVGTVTPICTTGTVYAVALDAGQGAAATLASRKLSGPDGAELNYGIYTDATRITVWGNGAGGTGWRVSSGTGAPQPVMMYGRVPAAQAAMVGSYSDTVTVTLTY